MIDGRDKYYESEIEKHIKEMIEILDIFSSKEKWIKTDFLAAERALQVLIESIIGLSRYVVEIQFQLKLSRSREALDELKKRGLLEEDVYTKMMKMIGFRNVLVHDYLNIDENVVKSICTKKNYSIVLTIHKILLDLIS